MKGSKLKFTREVFEESFRGNLTREVFEGSFRGKFSRKVYKGIYEDSLRVPFTGKRSGNHEVSPYSDILLYHIKQMVTRMFFLDDSLLSESDQKDETNFY